ncbi:hypothetical protein CUN61_14520 [Pseudomonas arsenicoxydans]|uniref:DUF1534 domain-containing protein n=1 Tax=Pseudomonas arsenicoxydans TaxID=702115 RepID=A0A4V0YJX2_9PSED|nr:hypothetical protein CUN61_14520 [Pseudomonas arsenicoxydans]
MPGIAPGIFVSVTPDRSHALRGNASMDALRPLRKGRGASWAAFPRGRFDASTWERSVPDRNIERHTLTTVCSLYHRIQHSRRRCHV